MPLLALGCFVCVIASLVFLLSANFAPSVMSVLVHVFFHVRVAANKLGSFCASLFSSSAIGNPHFQISSMLRSGICPPVQGVCFSGNPPAVRWLIISVVVNAVNFVSIRPLAHVANKFAKRIYPLFAYGYSSASVILVTLVMRVKATLLHRTPSPIKGMFMVSIFNFGGHSRAF